MVLHLDDLVLRRTTIWEDSAAAMESVPKLPALLDWDARRADKEISRLASALEPAT